MNNSLMIHGIDSVKLKYKDKEDERGPYYVINFSIKDIQGNSFDITLFSSKKVIVQEKEEIIKNE